MTASVTAYQAHQPEDPWGLLGRIVTCDLAVQEAVAKDRCDEDVNGAQDALWEALDAAREAVSERVQERVR